jgi:hypothetical protein
LQISPKKENRIPLGLLTSTGSIFYEKGRRYGFEWSSDLEYIHLVDRYDQVLRAGEAVLKDSLIILPQPVITYTNKES